MITRSVFFCLYLILATSSIFAADFGESVAKVWDKAKETFCHRVDGVIADIEACKQYTHKGGEKYFEELYEMARERLYAAVEQAKAAADYFISNSQGFADGAQQAAYEMYEGAKKGLQLASEQTYKAASKMVHSGQNYVEQAQRQSSNMYSEAMAMLNSAAEEARVIAQEVFEGKEHEPKEPFDNHDQVQDAYERVADAAARGIEKAFEKVAELGTQSFKKEEIRETKGGESGNAHDSPRKSPPYSEQRNELHEITDGTKRHSINEEEVSAEKKQLKVKTAKPTLKEGAKDANINPEFR